MTETSNWSVTLTGAVLANAEADAAWPKVAALLGGDTDSLRNRLPVTFKAHDEASARGQWDELNALGVEAVILPDDGSPRLWVRLEERTCGPVTQAYARHAHGRGKLPSGALACLHGQRDWQPLRELLGLPPDAPAQAPPVSDAAADGRLPIAIEAPYLHAGFWMRVGAYFIDSIIIAVVFIALAFVGGIVGAFSPTNPNDSVAGVLVFELIAVAGIWLYFALFESSSTQATPGKMALGLLVTDEQGRRIGFGRATGRYFGKILSGMILDIGYMMAGWTRRKQGLHDMIASCCVVRASSLAARTGDDER
ncbi:MAG TPA: RDD family protein [Oleiagrimonas sp.]|nr:RDD family protein [Oleiagrimonas sp.]